MTKNVTVLVDVGIGEKAVIKSGIHHMLFLPEGKEVICLLLSVLQEYLLGKLAKRYPSGSSQVKINSSLHRFWYSV